MEKPAKKKALTVREIAEIVGLSHSQINAAKKEGIDSKDIAGLMKYKANRAIIATSKIDGKPCPPPIGDDSAKYLLFTLEELEEQMLMKGLNPNEARTYKTQVDGLKSAAALRKEMNQLISRGECKEAMAKIAHGLTAFLKRLELEIPSICYGLPLPEAKLAVKTRLREIQASFSMGCEEFWTEHPEK